MSQALEHEVEELRLRLATMRTALDHMQSAATQAQAEVEREKARADGAERAHDQLVTALEQANAEVAQLRQALESQKEVSR